MNETTKEIKMTTTSKRREALLKASYRANRAADALRYLNSALGCASEAGLKLGDAMSTMREDLTKILERNAETAGFKAREFYSEE